MKITVLIGSPKGDVSITYQFLKYIEKKFPNVEFEEFKISQQIKSIENNNNKFDEIMNSIKSSDAVLWLTPVYHFTIPGQLKRFVELIFERGCENYFKGKYATLLTTSIHFYDHMAENYIQGISEDLEMKYVRGFLAGMNDLPKQEKRDMLIDFFTDFKRKVENEISVNSIFPKVNKIDWEFNPQKIEEVSKNSKHKILAITDIENNDSNIAKMLETYKKLIPNEIEIINLNDLNIKSGCIGCCICGGNNVCSISDDLIEIYHDKMEKADAIVYFGEIKDRYLSAKFKIFFDRSFVRGHAPVYTGKHIAYVISGPLSQIPNLREEIRARTEAGGLNFVDVVSDEIVDEGELVKKLKDSAENLIYYLNNNISTQSGFYETSAHKIFRDFIHGIRPVFAADHRFYAKNKGYDFPNKNIIKTFFSQFLYILLKNKKIRKVFNTKMKVQMIMPSKRVVDEF